jgi:ribosomal protein S18 acetylase RimI-like enzyme
MAIRPFRRADEAQVVALWQACGLTRPWNDPHKDIERKLAVQPELFLVGQREERVVATVMAGYDGHRAWMYYLAVAPGLQGQGLGSRLVQHVEGEMLARGCPKVNLLVRSTNAQVLAFYRKLGYAQDEAVPLGKRLIPDT